MTGPPVVPVRDVELVVLDMAGTTVHDGGQVPAAFRSALAAHGVAVTDDELASVRGASKREVIRTLVTRHQPDALPSLVDEVHDEFRAALAERYRAGVRAVDGVEDMFAWLRRREVRIALNTGFDRTTAELLLDALGWRDGRVDAVVCGDEVPRGRPAPYLIFRAMEAAGATSVHRVMNVGIRSWTCGRDGTPAWDGTWAC